MIKEGVIKGEQKLYYSENIIENPIGAVLIVHGAGEHIGRYGYVQRKLEKSGFTSMGCDLRGHGKSEGIRCHVNSYHEYIEDIYRIMELFEERYGTLPKFILGHSMGGLLTLRFCELNVDKFNAVGVSSPLLGFKIPISGFKKQLGNILTSILPRTSFNNGIKHNMISRSREVVERYGTDPYVYGKVTSRWYTEISRAIEETLAEAEKLTYPITIFQAGDDLLVDPLKTEYFYNKCGSRDKHFELFAGLYHEIMNEPERDTIIDKYIEFFKKRI